MSQDATRELDPRTADVYDVLDELSDIVEEARAMPMSDKAVISRNQVLDLLDAMRQMLPTAVQEAEELLADRVGVVEEGFREAERMIAEATHEANTIIATGHAEQAQLVSVHEVLHVAMAEAEAIRQQAREEAEATRREAEQYVREVDQYVEGKLAAFEASLAKTLGTIQRGRERIRERFGPVDLDEQS